MNECFVFLTEDSICSVDVKSGNLTGYFQFKHPICDEHFTMTSVTPALYWADGFLVCQETKDKDGKSITRFHYYGLPSEAATIAIANCRPSAD